MKSLPILRLALITFVLLLIPYFGNQYLEGWNWSPSDFVFAAILTLGAGVAYELFAKRSGNASFRAGAAVALGASFLLIWINGAVGLIGSETNEVNMLYAFVVFIGILGAVAARPKARGMSRALFVMAVAQFLVPIVALFVNPNDFSPGLMRVFALNSLFVVLFAGAGLLFRNAEA